MRETFLPIRAKKVLIGVLATLRVAKAEGVLASAKDRVEVEHCSVVVVEQPIGRIPHEPIVTPSRR